MSSLHELVAGFADAAAYERGRPGYPPRAVAAIVAALGLERRARVVDLGAGTGKLTRALLAAGVDALAVEPLAPMRRELARHVDPVRILDGRAEGIPLPDGSIDAVIAAGAFHWFHHDRALPEIRRVLRPGGGVAIVGLRPAWGAGELPWEAELRSLLAESRPQHPDADGPTPEEAFERIGGFAALELTEVDVEHAATRESMLANVASFSWVGAMEPEARAAVLERADAILRDAGIDEVVLPLRVTIRVTWAL
ncbi:MAG TPA: methyltransferase domain-containing protein [Solirubrobacteraceae bacterium]|nr:methyltransferase domain-containing protein [Solirubrobacteraceae bacterium]